VRCSRNPLAASCDSLASRIARTAKAVGATMISFDSDGDGFIERNPEAFGGFRRATWAPRLSAADSATVTRLTNLDRYDVVLIHFPSRMDN